MPPEDESPAAPPEQIPDAAAVMFDPGPPPSYGNGFVPDPRFAAMHAEIDARYRDILTNHRHLLLNPEPLPVYFPRPARPSRPDDGEPATRGEVRALRRLLRQLQRQSDCLTADAMRGLLARVESLERGSPAGRR